jgi:hypothetical protein
MTEDQKELLYLIAFCLSLSALFYVIATARL